MSQPLSRTLAIELLDKASNPDHTPYSDQEDDDPEPDVRASGLCAGRLGAVEGGG